MNIISGQKQRILVTGGLGFIGSHFVDELIDQLETTRTSPDSYEIHVVDNLSTGLLENRNPKAVTFVMGVSEFCHKFDYKYDKIFHLANCARIVRSFEYTEETLLNNYDSTVALCEYIRRTGSGHLFFASSSTTEFTDHFNNPYTFSKFMCDHLLEFYRVRFNIPSSLVKFYNVYGSMREKDLGEHTTIIRKFKQKVLNNEPLTIVGDGTRRRDFTSIDDTVNALMLLNRLDGSLETSYHIGTGVNYSILEIAKAFDHPYVFVEDRAYELKNTVCSGTKVPLWKPYDDVIDHIKQWRTSNALS